MEKKKWILVTGSAKGLGKALALELASRGHSIAVHYKESEKEAEEVVQACLKKQVQAKKIQGDFATSYSLNAFINNYLETFPDTKGIVNGVGNYLITPFSETSQEEWQSLFQTNVIAPGLIIKALLPSLIQNQGRIVNVGTSGLNGTQGKIQAPAYTATKRALHSLTLSLAKELASQGVSVNMVSPAYMVNAIDSIDSSKLPRGRAASLEEVARMVAFLFEEDNGYITGQNIEVAGGVGL